MRELGSTKAKAKVSGKANGVCGSALRSSTGASMLGSRIFGEVKQKKHLCRINTNVKVRIG
jgi:hypothetical protein